MSFLNIWMEKPLCLTLCLFFPSPVYTSIYFSLTQVSQDAVVPPGVPIPSGTPTLENDSLA